MRRLIRLILFLLVFVIEVRVNASAGIESATTYPNDCWQKNQMPCAVHVGTRAITSRWGDLRVRAPKDSVFVVLETNLIRLVDGIVWVESEKPFRVDGTLGTAMSSGGEVWVKIEKTGGTEFTAPLNGFEIQPLGQTEKLSLLPGMELVLRPANQERKVTWGLPMALHLKQHLKLRSQLSELAVEDFERSIQPLMDHWARATRLTSEWHSQVVERKLAFQDQQRHLKKLLEEQQERERLQIRKLFYQRNHLEP